MVYKESLDISVLGWLDRKSAIKWLLPVIIQFLCRCYISSYCYNYDCKKPIFDIKIHALFPFLSYGSSFKNCALTQSLHVQRDNLLF